MLYLLLCSLVMLITIITFHERLFQLLSWAANPDGAKPNLLAPALVLVATVAYSAPMMEIFYRVLTTQEDSFIGGDLNWIVWCVLAGAVTLMLYAAHQARTALSRGKFGFWPAGQLTILVLAGVVGSVSAYKHLTFFADDKAGIVNMELLTEIAGLPEGPACLAAIVRLEESGPATYRCPEVLMFSRHTAAPFIPWPSFTEGSSVELGEALRQAMREAKANTAEIGLTD